MESRLKKKFLLTELPVGWRIGLGIGVGVVVLLTAMAVVSYGLYQQSFVSTLPANFMPPGESPQPSPTPDPLRPFSIALLGYGGVGHEGGSLTDSMMVVQIRPRDKKIIMISLPRDTWVALPIQEPPHQAKINTAYSIGNDDKRYPDKPAQYSGEGGGGALVKYALNQVLGISVDYFVAVDFDGFKLAIDKLGGVPVRVPRTFEDPLYPIAGKEQDTCEKSAEELVAIATLSAQKREEAFTCRYEVLHFDQGLQTMDGETALKFVRSRHSPTDGGDINRASRQRALLLGVKEKILSLDALTKVPSILASLSWHVRTDIPLSQLQAWLGEISEWQSYTIHGVALTHKEVLKEAKSSDGQYILIPTAGDGQWQGVHDWINDQIQTVVTATASAAPTVKPTSQATTPGTSQGTSPATPE